MKIGILTGGGDCPGMNAAIRAVAKTAINDYHMDVVGILDGYQGLIENRIRPLRYNEASGILNLGGTILGTSNRANPFRVPKKRGKKTVFIDDSKRAIKTYKSAKLDALVCVGGDGTLSIAYELYKKGMNIVGIPKTIDNDVSETDYSIGFDTAVSIVSDAIDRIHTTAQSHHRVMVIETMGRYAGWIAIVAGLASGGDIILIPEIPYEIEKICKKVKERNKHGKRFSILVIAEGSKPKKGTLVVKKIVEDSTDPIRLGGIGRVVATDIEKYTGIETRVTTLGHLQRGGNPTAFDRVLATRCGTEAVYLVKKRKFGNMVRLKNDKIAYVSLAKVVSKKKLVPKNHPLIKSAKSVGTIFGD